ncbi:MAG: NAD(P)-dependent oxidoreductase [Treponema sp.]|jgi:3-hydroxyisobutyrate dehydrogenase/2-hydroxy-3-oxopropionate reductase|nr:NAD(P)-dependent oxidoreductase [Treponema sp.]
MIKTIGFIGLGIMGKSMARNLMKAGFEVHIFARTKAKVMDILNDGAVWSATIGECAKNRDAVITIVGFPSDVDEVYNRDGNILDSADRGTILIDMTTTSPELDRKIAADAENRGLRMLDAPVTGGDTGAKNGTLTILVGGDKETFDICRPLFAAMGKNIVYEGKTGSGQHTKMVNQIMIAGALSGVCEGLSYARRAGLDMATVLKSVSTGAAASAQLSNLGGKMIREDYEPGFFLKHFIKDMRIADEEATQRKLELPVLQKVLSECRELEKTGFGEKGTQVLLKYYTGEQK